jgi:hypothetical protein
MVYERRVDRSPPLGLKQWGEIGRAANTRRKNFLNWTAQMKRKTLADIADQGAENIARTQAAREDRRTANKAIHAAGGPQVAVWDEVAAGATVVSIAKGLGLSLSTFNRWLYFMPERESLYREARKKAAQVIGEQTIEIADAATIEDLPTARLRIDGRVKLAERYAPEGFGAKASRDGVQEITLEALQLRAEKRSKAQ